MNKIRILLFLMATVAFWATVAANNATPSYPYSISGQVTDEQGEPLAGVSVWVKGTTIGAQTDAKGIYLIKIRERKEVTLRFSYMGHETLFRNVIFPESGQAKISVTLKSSANRLDEVVVTGNRREKKLKDVPELVQVIGHHEIARLNPVSFESLLQYELPGLQIGFNSMSEKPTIKYQGVSGEYLLFLIDGERVSGEGSSQMVDLSRFNIDDIERVEVIKGAQSTLYGSNALGGVINVITKKANRPLMGNINIRYAGTNGQKYTMNVGVKRSNFSAYTSATHRRMDTYTINDVKGKEYVTITPNGSTKQVDEPASTTINGYQIWDFTQRLGYVFDKKFSAEVKGTYYHNKQNKRTYTKYRDYFSDCALNGRLNYLPSENHEVHVSYVFDRYKKDKDFEEADFVRTDYINSQHILRADYTGTFGSHTLSTGIDANHEYLKHYMLKDSADAVGSNTALYLQEDWKITPQVNLVAGVRADYHTKYHWHATPKISLLYRPAEWLTFRGGYSHGYRSPTLKELYEQYDMGGLGFMMIYGNKDLKPETSRQMTLSTEFNFGVTNLSVSGYHNRFKDKIVMRSTGDGSQDLRYVNAESAKTSGVDCMLISRIGRKFRVTGSYSYVKDYQEVEGKNTSYIRPHSITFGGTYRHDFGPVHTTLSLNGQWASPLTTHYFSNKKKYEEIHYDGRTLCSLNLTVKVPRGISVMLGVDNLFNYKDKAADSSLQLPQKGISMVSTLNINLADLFGK